MSEIFAHLVKDFHLVQDFEQNFLLILCQPQLWCQEIYWRRRRWQTGQRQKAPISVDIYWHIKVLRQVVLKCFMLCRWRKASRSSRWGAFFGVVEGCFGRAGPKQRDFHRWYHGMRYLDATPVILWCHWGPLHALRWHVSTWAFYCSSEACGSCSNGTPSNTQRGGFQEVGILASGCCFFWNTFAIFFLFWS